MRKLTALILVAVLLSVMLASPVTATRFDPKNPSWALQRQSETHDNGDDNGFGEMDSPPDDAENKIFNCFSFPFLKIIRILIFDHFILDDNANTDTGNTQQGSGINSQ